MLEYPVSYHGSAEAIVPQFPPTEVPRHLSLQWIPRTINPAYSFWVQRAVLTRSETIDPINPDRIFLELMPDPNPIDEGRAMPIDYKKRRRIANRKFPHVRSISKAFIFSNSNWGNHYHFLIDACVRYADLRCEGIVTDDVTLLFHSTPTTRQSEFLEFLKIDWEKGRLIEPLNPAPIVADQLLIASPPRSRSHVSRRAIGNLRDLMMPAAGASNGNKGRRIYISRRSAGKRHIENEEEIVDVLQQRGFEIVEPETLSPKEQIVLFAEAGWIVGPHGAAFTNMVFSDSPKIIEFLPADRWNLGWFAALSLCLGATYHPLVSHPADGVVSGIRRSTDDSNYTVDVAALRKILDQN
jgi:capsular polysaccharide biosynthesis protein